MEQTAVGILYKFLYEMESFEGFNPYNFNQEEVFAKAKAMEIEQNQKYAEFCVECDRKGMPLLDFKSWIEL